jgi:hypothetical protein
MQVSFQDHQDIRIIDLHYLCANNLDNFFEADNLHLASVIDGMVNHEYDIYFTIGARGFKLEAKDEGDFVARYAVRKNATVIARINRFAQHKINPAYAVLGEMYVEPGYEKSGLPGILMHMGADLLDKSGLTHVVVRPVVGGFNYNPLRSLGYGNLVRIPEMELRRALGGTDGFLDMLFKTPEYSSPEILYKAFGK